MEQIIEDYVSFDVAKLLKEKGFNEECRAAYTNYGKLFTIQIQKYITNILCNKSTLWYCTAPTQQMTMKWLRKVHKLHIEPHIQTNKNYNGNIYNLYGELLLEFIGESPAQACETAIKYCLEHLI